MKSNVEITMLQPHTARHMTSQFIAYIPEGMKMMRLSNYFLPVLKENPKEAQIASHRLMLRAGMISNQAQAFIHGCRLG